MNSVFIWSTVYINTLSCFALWPATFVDIRENNRPRLYSRQRHKTGNRKHVLRIYHLWFPSDPIRPHNGNIPVDHTHLEVSVNF